MWEFIKSAGTGLLLYTFSVAYWVWWISNFESVEPNVMVLFIGAVTLFIIVSPFIFIFGILQTIWNSSPSIRESIEASKKNRPYKDIRRDEKTRAIPRSRPVNAR